VENGGLTFDISSEKSVGRPKTEKEAGGSIRTPAPVIEPSEKPFR
jgi:hypothetical protein